MGLLRGPILLPSEFSDYHCEPWDPDRLRVQRWLYRSGRVEHDLAKFSCGDPTGTPGKLGWRELPCLSCRHIQFWHRRDCFERLSGLRVGDVLDHPGGSPEQQLLSLCCRHIRDWKRPPRQRQMHTLRHRHILKRVGGSSVHHMPAILCRHLLHRQWSSSQRGLSRLQCGHLLYCSWGHSQQHVLHLPDMHQRQVRLLRLLCYL